MARRVAEKGIDGLGKVTVTPEKIKIKYTDGQTFDILPEDIYEGVKVVDGTYFVGLNAEGNKIRSTRPVKGTYRCKFDHFGGKKDEPPIYYEKKTDNFGNPPHLEFWIIFKVVDKEFAGFEIARSYWYCFKRDNSPEFEGKIMLSGSGSRTMEELLQELGVPLEDISFDYSDNILPELFKLIKSKDKELVVTVGDKGYVKSVTQMP
jgi:hypothetical protein